jgi:hypothetical protein
MDTMMTIYSGNITKYVDVIQTICHLFFTSNEMSSFFAATNGFKDMVRIFLMKHFQDFYKNGVQFNKLLNAFFTSLKKTACFVYPPL